MLFRFYIENSRYIPNSPYNNDIKSLITEAMKRLLKIGVGQHDLHTFSTLCELRAQSEGSPITPQHITEVEALFESIVQNRINI